MIDSTERKPDRLNLSLRFCYYSPNVALWHP